MFKVIASGIILLGEAVLSSMYRLIPSRHGLLNLSSNVSGDKQKRLCFKHLLEPELVSTAEAVHLPRSVQ